MTNEQTLEVVQIQLKLCPFCGGEPALKDSAFGVYVYCKNCEVKTPLKVSGNIKKTIAAWNTRVN